MLAADAYFQIRFDAAATLRAEAHQLAYAFAVEHLERIVGENLPVDVCRQKAARVIAAQAKRRLRQIIRAEREEVGMLSNLAGGQSSTWQLDHSSDCVLDLHPVFAGDLAGNVVNHLGLLFQFFANGNQWHHDLQSHLLPLALHLARGFKNRAALHARDFRKQQTQAATAEAEHRVCFADFIDVMQQLPLLINLIQQVIHVGERSRVTQSHLQLREFAEKFIHVRQEFVQRRIE